MTTQRLLNLVRSDLNNAEVNGYSVLYDDNYTDMDIACELKGDFTASTYETYTFEEVEAAVTIIREESQAND